MFLWSRSFWCVKVIGQHTELVILQMNMWVFVSCRVAVPKIFKYGGFTNLDFTSI
jgi:hypothetical protein